MLASLYYIFGNTEKYDNLTGSLIGIVLFLIGMIATFILYSIYLVDTSLDKFPAQKNERLRVIIVGGFTISLLISVYTAFSINRYNFCMENKDVCIADYAVSPFS